MSLAWQSRQSLFKGEHGGTFTEWAGGRKIPHSTRSKTFAPPDSRWLCEPGDCLLDPYVTQVTMVMPAGSAKSLLGELYSDYVVGNDDGILYYVCQSDEAAQDVGEDRLFPLFEANGTFPLVNPLDRSQKRVSKVQFPNVTLYLLGAKLNAAQSKRVRHLVCEETHTWKPGMLAAFKQRCNAVVGPKILVLTTGSITDDETDKDFRAGSMHEWHVLCPECKNAQAMKNVNLRYEISERTMDHDQNFRWSALRASVYYQCEHCPAQWRDTPETRRFLQETGHYIQTNPNAAEKNRSFHINALAIHWFSWADLAVEWIEATRASKVGSFGLLRDYIMKKLAEAWDEKPREDNPKLQEARVSKLYKAGKHWKDEDGKPFWEDGWVETTRFLTLDKQESWFTGVIRAYGLLPDGTTEHRMVLEFGGVPPGEPGCISTFEECEDLREKYHVEALRTFCDCGHFTKEVQARCVQYGWQALWGSEQKSWPHDLKSPFHPVNVAKFNRQPFKHLSEKPVRLPFSPPQKGHANIGKAGKAQLCTYYFWSNPVIKDFWHFLHNAGDGRWTQYEGTSKQYNKQSCAEYKRLEYDKASGQKQWKWTYRGDNHATDAEQENLAVAMMDDRLSIAAPELTTEEI